MTVKVAKSLGAKSNRQVRVKQAVHEVATAPGKSSTAPAKKKRTMRSGTIPQIPFFDVGGNPLHYQSHKEGKKCIYKNKRK